ncbi:MAG: hypothetical protein GY862_30445 [Gammaproteobacteria bacterium]|nr:hypothetical protein [Gammaproteobacteria bacterium]
MLRNNDTQDRQSLKDWQSCEKTWQVFFGLFWRPARFGFLLCRRADLGTGKKSGTDTGTGTRLSHKK